MVQGPTGLKFGSVKSKTEAEPGKILCRSDPDRLKARAGCNTQTIQKGRPG